ncbi:MAG: BTAD domain-containing putative transcriptional regulator [Gemmatimonadota bacterium]
MYRLVLLGGLRLEDAEGPMSGRASQRRRLGLLALMAAPSGGLIGRDKLVGYLWPERSDERARRSLSTALYDIRQDLGEDAIRSPGDELGLNPSLITSDVAEFLEAVERGDPEAVVDLYTGPFLDGAHIGASAAFEEWVDAERQRYARLFREALEQVARMREDEGDVRGAADAWRRLAAEDRYNRRVALGYMKALVAAGERARAIEFAGVHAALLREELEAEPDPSVMAMAERLREQPPPSGEQSPESTPPVEETAAPRTGSGPERTATAPVPRQDRSPRHTLSRPRVLLLALLGLAAVLVLVQALPRGPTRLAVLPLENLGDPADDYFALGLTEELTLALAGIEGFRGPGPSSTFAYQDRSVAAPQVARELGVDFLLRGTVRRHGTRQRTTIILLDARGDILWSEPYESRVGDDLKVQERIALAVVNELRPRFARERGGLGDGGVLDSFASADPRARDHYRRARAHWYTRRTPRSLEAALDEYRKALAFDSAYARAYAGIADVHNAMGAYEQAMREPGDAYPRAKEAAQTALAFEPDLAEAHAALGVALFNYDWRWDAAKARFLEALEHNPGDSMTRHWLSHLLRATGDTTEAMRQITEALDRDPSSAVIATSLCRHHYFAREFERAMAACAVALGTDSTYVNAHLMTGLAAVQQGDADAALQHYAMARDLLRKDSVTAPVVEALTAHARGQAGDTALADSIYQTLATAAERAQQGAGPYVAPQFVAVAALGARRYGPAIDWLGRALDQRSAAMI